MNREAVRRRFTLLDAMVLVAATAVGIAAAQGSAEPIRRSLLGLTTFSQPLRFLVVASPLLTPWSVALLGLALRPPRPPLRRLLGRPGIAALMASPVLAPLVAIRVAIILRSVPINARGEYGIRLFWLNLIPAVDSAVAVAWLSIWLGGRWRRSADWIDAAGRALGLAWFATDLALQLRWWAA